MRFTKYLIDVNSQNVMSCHRLVGVNSHSDKIIRNISLGLIITLDKYAEYLLEIHLIGLLVIATKMQN